MLVQVGAGVGATDLVPMALFVQRISATHESTINRHRHHSKHYFGGSQDNQDVVPVTTRAEVAKFVRRRRVTVVIAQRCQSIDYPTRKSSFSSLFCVRASGIVVASTTNMLIRRAKGVWMDPSPKTAAP
jgi:hypothetical protein